MVEMELVYALVILDAPQGQEPRRFNNKGKAIQVAEILVRNRSWAWAGDIGMLGPGDGTTSHIVRAIPKKWLSPEQIAKIE